MVMCVCAWMHLRAEKSDEDTSGENTLEERILQALASGDIDATFIVSLADTYKKRESEVKKVLTFTQEDIAACTESMSKAMASAAQSSVMDKMRANYNQSVIMKIIAGFALNDSQHTDYIARKFMQVNESRFKTMFHDAYVKAFECFMEKTPVEESIQEQVSPQTPKSKPNPEKRKSSSAHKPSSSSSKKKRRKSKTPEKQIPSTENAGLLSRTSGPMSPTKNKIRAKDINIGDGVVTECELGGHITQTVIEDHIMTANYHHIRQEDAKELAENGEIVRVIRDGKVFIDWQK